MIKYEATNKYRHLTVALLCIVLLLSLVMSNTKELLFIIPVILVLVFSVLFRSKGNYLMISEDGFEERSSFKRVHLNWNEIQDCEVVIDEGVKILGIKLQGKKQNFILKTFMYGNVLYLNNQYSVDLEVIAEKIKEKISTRGLK